MYEVGQKLWFVDEDKYRRSHEVTVVKVGRVWATLHTGLRCDASGLVDGGNYSSPGRCYIDRGAYEYEQARENAWQTFQRALERKKMPASLTLDALAQISITLNITPLEISEKDRAEKQRLYESRFWVCPTTGETK